MMQIDCYSPFSFIKLFATKMILWNFCFLMFYNILIALIQQYLTYTNLFTVSLSNFLRKIQRKIWKHL